MQEFQKLTMTKLTLLHCEVRKSRRDTLLAYTISVIPHCRQREEAESGHASIAAKPCRDVFRVTRSSAQCQKNLCECVTRCERTKNSHALVSVKWTPRTDETMKDNVSGGDQGEMDWMESAGSEE